MWVYSRIQGRIVPVESMISIVMDGLDVPEGVPIRVFDVPYSHCFSGYLKRGWNNISIDQTEAGGFRFAGDGETSSLLLADHLSDDRIFRMVVCLIEFFDVGIFSISCPFFNETLPLGNLIIGDRVFQSIVERRRHLPLYRRTAATSPSGLLLCRFPRQASPDHHSLLLLPPAPPTPPVALLPLALLTANPLPIPRQPPSLPPASSSYSYVDCFVYITY